MLGLCNNHDGCWADECVFKTVRTEVDVKLLQRCR